MWILVITIIIILIFVFCLTKQEDYLYLKDKLFVNNGSELDTLWRDQSVFGANQLPDSLYSRKRFLGPGFYSTSNWKIAPRPDIKEDTLPILGRMNDNSVKGAQKYYRLFY